jgi:transglutaminase-like putative cysteine protease
MSVRWPSTRGPACRVTATTESPVPATTPAGYDTARPPVMRARAVSGSADAAAAARAWQPRSWARHGPSCSRAVVSSLPPGNWVSEAVAATSYATRVAQALEAKDS